MSLNTFCYYSRDCRDPIFLLESLMEPKPTGIRSTVFASKGTEEPIFLLILSILLIFSPKERLTAEAAYRKRN